MSFLLLVFLGKHSHRMDLLAADVRKLEPDIILEEKEQAIQKLENNNVPALMVSQQKC